MRLERYRKRRGVIWGGASAYQKGVAAELRTFTKPRSTLTNLLNTIVHSGDKTPGSTFLRDIDNKYDPAADDIIVSGILEAQGALPYRQKKHRIEHYLANRKREGSFVDQPAANPADPWVAQWADLKPAWQANNRYSRRMAAMAANPGNAANVYEPTHYIPISSEGPTPGRPTVYTGHAPRGPASLQWITAVSDPAIGPELLAHREDFGTTNVDPTVPPMSGQNAPLASGNNLVLPINVMYSSVRTLPRTSPFYYTVRSDKTGPVQPNGQLRPDWVLLQNNNGLPYPDSFQQLAFFRPARTVPGANGQPPQQIGDLRVYDLPPVV